MGGTSSTAFSLTDAIIHVLLVAFSALVLAISILAHAEKGTRRHLFLVFAFGFLFLSQIVELIETLALSNQLILIPFTQVHVSHFLDFLMLSSFSIALLVRT